MDSSYSLINKSQNFATLTVHPLFQGLLMHKVIHQGGNYVNMDDVLARRVTCSSIKGKGAEISSVAECHLTVASHSHTLEHLIFIYCVLPVAVHLVTDKIIYINMCIALHPSGKLYMWNLTDMLCGKQL